MRAMSIMEFPDLRDDAPPPREPATKVGPYVFLLLLGLFLIFAMAFWESQRLRDDPWAGALASVDGEPPWEEAVPLWARQLPGENFAGNAFTDGLREYAERYDTRQVEIIEAMGLDDHEHVLALELPLEAWENMLASGRLPQPGAPEVLAGPIARLDAFTLDGATFEVTGTIRREIAPFTFAYALPADPGVVQFFTPEAGATEGWLDIDGMARLGELEPSADPEADPEEDRGLLQPNAQTGAVIVLGVIGGLALMALGGTGLAYGLCVWLAGWNIPFLGAFLQEVKARPGLFWGLHIFHYSTFFGSMLLATVTPVSQMRALQMLQGVFREGDLQHIFEAYASESILAAAWVTFYQNFVVSTLFAGVLPSLIIPGFAILKNTLSLIIVGYPIAPMWTGMAGMYTYHSGTMILELGAYMIASFAVLLLPIHFVKTVRTGEFKSGIGRGLYAMAGGTVFVAALLAIAALYEATTLILLN